MKLRFKNPEKPILYLTRDEIEPNPKNWRTHPKAQRDALAAVMTEVGIADVMIGYYPAGSKKVRLIDGHARRETMAKGDTFPVLVLDVNEDEADKLLATIDPLAAMAGTEKTKLAELVARVKTDDSALTDMLERLGSQTVALVQEVVNKTPFIPPVANPIPVAEFSGGAVDSIRYDPETKSHVVVPHDPDSGAPPAAFVPREGDNEILELNAEVMFPSKNTWGVPDLRGDMLCETYPTETFALSSPHMPQTKEDCDRFLFMPYSTTKDKPPGGYLGFYAFDDAFDRAWTDSVEYAEKLRSKRWTGVLSPDFSTWAHEPPALSLWALYRSRWVARYWQELGVRIIPSIQTVPKWFGLGPSGGLPRGCPVVSCQVRTGSQKKSFGKEYDASKYESFVKSLGAAVEDVQPRVVLVYGGQKNADVLSALPAGPKYVLLPAYMDIQDALKKAKKKAGKTGDTNS